MIGRKDIGSGYAISGDKSQIEWLAFHLGVPLWQAEMILAEQGFADPANDAKCRSNPMALDAPVDPKARGNGWVDPIPHQRSSYQDKLVDNIAEKFEPSGKPKG